MVISHTLKAMAKQIPYLGIALEVIDSVSESSEKAALLERLSETEKRLNNLEHQRLAPQAITDIIQADVRRLILAATAAGSRSHFRIFISNEAKVWAYDAIPDDHRAIVIEKQVQFLAEMLHYFCANATIIVDANLPDPDIDFVEINGWYRCLARFDRSNLDAQQLILAQRTIKKCVDEASRKMSNEIGFQCGTFSSFENFQPISMVRVLEDGRTWQFEIRTDGWAGNLNYDRINHEMWLVQNQAPRSILNYAAYQLRNIHSAPNPTDLSGKFLYFERMHLHSHT
jgi:hypothetical protein